MALFSELNSVLTLNNRPFNTSLKQSEAKVDQFATKSSSAFSKIGTLAGGAATAGIAILVTSIAGAITKMDTLVDKADNLRIGVDKFQELSYAADQFGSSTSTLSSLLTRMGKTIGDAAGGSDKASKAFSRIGLNVKELIGLSPDEQFKKIASAISLISDKNEQASAAFGILGRKSSEAMTLLNSDLTEAGKRARDLGLVVDTETATNVANLADKTKELGTAWTTTFAKLTAIAAPVLTFLINRFGELLSVIGSIVGGIAKVGSNLVGMGKESLGIGQYNPNAYQKPTFKPTDFSQFDPDALAKKIYGARNMSISSANTTTNSASGSLTDNTFFKILQTSFESLASASERAKSSLQNFSMRMDQLQDLRNNRYDDYRGKPQLRSQEFDDIAKELIDKQLSGSLTTSYAKNRLSELSSITQDNLKIDESGQFQEFSTSSLKGDLKQLQELLLGNNKNELEITVNPSPEFETKITKISENSFTNLLTREATGTNR